MHFPMSNYFRNQANHSPRLIAQLTFANQYRLPEFRYLEYYPAADSELTRTYIGKSAAYRFGYACVLYSSVFFVLPLAALAVLNTRLVVALRRGKRHWLRLKSNQRREQNLAVIPMTVVVVFLVCGSPALVVNVLDSYDSELFRLVISNVRYCVLVNGW